MTLWSIATSSWKQEKGNRLALSTRRILQAEISVCTGADAINAIISRMERSEKTKLGFANANLLVQLRRHNCEEIVDDFMLLNDGLAIDIGSSLLFGENFPENLNGTDFIGKLLEALPKSTRIFLFGARPHVIAAAATEIENQFELKVCGLIDGYRSPLEWSVDDITRATPDVILVALGNPLQEIWIEEYADKIDAKLFIGVGAWFDFFTQDKRRAPTFIRELRLEWIHRLAQEPRRLWRRYSVDAVIFCFLLFSELFRQRNLRRRKS